MDGGEHICLASWESVSMMLQLVSDVQLNKYTHTLWYLQERRIFFFYYSRERLLWVSFFNIKGPVD